MSMRKVLVLNGPNLDMLGMREPEVYGKGTLDKLERQVVAYAESHGIEAVCRQSNSESKLIRKIHDAVGKYDGIIYNPGAHTHYSYALRDAVAAIDVPVVEVHLSEIDERESFRKVSVIAPACIAQVKGLGVEGYFRAVDILAERGDLVRLGEGYERLFHEGQNVLIASRVQTDLSVEGEPQGNETDSSDSAVAPTAAEDAPDSESSARLGGDMLLFSGSSGASRAELSQDQDFSAPFASSATSADVGLLSFERQTAVRSAIARLGLNALLVRETSNIRWVTAFDGVFDEERAHALLVGDSGTFLHTDSRYGNAIRMAASGVGSDIVVNEDRVNHAQFAYDALTQRGQYSFVGRLGIEDTFTYAEFVKMVDNFQTTGLAPTTDVVLGLRAVKDDGEIARMRAAQAVTDAAFSYIVKFMKPGMTEREVQLELESYMLRHGGEALAFRSIVAAGANGADPHAVPGNTHLEAGQCVVMDFGAKAFGYCSDMTRTVFLGQPEGIMVQAWETLRQANEAVENFLKPGVTGAAAHQLAEQVLERGGFGSTMGHGLGHGVGIDVHELPVLNTRNDKPLVPGNVVTVEPGIYLPGRFGMRLEDFGVVTASGYDVFTQSTHEMVII